jgi:DNA-binding IclR family transcriptional regulator
MNEEFSPLHTKADEVLDLLLTEKELTVAEIAKRIEQPEVYVRHIANVFEKNGLVSVEVNSLKMTLKLTEYDDEEITTDDFHSEAREMVHSLLAEAEKKKSASKTPAKDATAVKTSKSAKPATPSKK